MRTVLALAAVAATSLFGLGTAASATAATGCHATAHGLTISHIETHDGLTCDHARTVIHHALRGTERSIGWTCSKYGSHHIPYSCWATNHSHHWVTFFVVVGDGTGPGGF
ncbi:hypothetical protein ABLE68_09025 [Nocardioides sp. CN2-186]|uniref:hypothetical protein n=1 Tax=Nocardioides tweenelious TaxID=3156607 RepID=UPI0032B36E88